MGGKREKRTEAAAADHDKVEKESDSPKEGKVLPRMTATGVGKESDGWVRTSE
jgi:hypothetical protein